MRSGFEYLLCLILVVTIDKLLSQLYLGVFNLEKGIIMHVRCNSTSCIISYVEKYLMERTMWKKKA